MQINGDRKQTIGCLGTINRGKIIKDYKTSEQTFIIMETPS